MLSGRQNKIGKIKSGLKPREKLDRNVRFISGNEWPRNCMANGHFNLDAVMKKLSLFLPGNEYLVQPVPPVTH
jgi:ABC-type cobalamin transport system ATPase subunit